MVSFGFIINARESPAKNITGNGPSYRCTTPVVPGTYVMHNYTMIRWSFVIVFFKNGVVCVCAFFSPTGAVLAVKRSVFDVIMKMNHVIYE